ALVIAFRQDRDPRPGTPVPAHRPPCTTTRGGAAPVGTTRERGPRRRRMIASADAAAFVAAATAVGTAPLVPEIPLHLATSLLPLWHMTEEQLEKQGVPPPFWAFAWAGGQALARFILDD